MARSRRASPAAAAATAAKTFSGGDRPRGGLSGMEAPQEGRFPRPGGGSSGGSFDDGPPQQRWRPSAAAKSKLNDLQAKCNTIRAPPRDPSRGEASNVQGRGGMASYALSSPRNSSRSNGAHAGRSSGELSSSPMSVNTVPTDDGANSPFDFLFQNCVRSGCNQHMQDFDTIPVDDEAEMVTRTFHWRPEDFPLEVATYMQCDGPWDVNGFKTGRGLSHKLAPIGADEFDDSMLDEEEDDDDVRMDVGTEGMASVSSTAKPAKAKQAVAAQERGDRGPEQDFDPCSFQGGGGAGPEQAAVRDPPDFGLEPWTEEDRQPSQALDLAVATDAADAASADIGWADWTAASPLPPAAVASTGSAAEATAVTAAHEESPLLLSSPEPLLTGSAAEADVREKEGAPHAESDAERLRSKALEAQLKAQAEEIQRLREALAAASVTGNAAGPPAAAGGSDGLLV